ncbi:MAG: M36 family metallopeptidase, partial [Bacteroidota bacterium]
MLKRVLSYFLFLICCPLVAQVDDAAAVAQRYLETHYNELELTVTDVQNYVLSSQTSSKHNGLTHVYLQQVHANIPVHNAILNLNIKEDGSLLSLGNRFVSDLANKVNTTSPSLGARDAVLRMMNHFNLPNADALGNGTEKEPGQWVFAPEGLALESINVSLRYQSLATGEVRLAWNVDFYQLDAQHWWQARVDTQTGQLIGRNDQVVHCEFDHPHYHEKNGIVEIAMGNEALSFLTTNGDDPAYRVFPLFIESPNHGNRELLVDPADPVASPFGWHDVNAQEGAEYTITRGNNVHAYHDILGINQSSGDEPDGGDSLCFDFPLCFTPPLPYTQLDAATTNLFYWNNLTHDLWYYYGFDEGSGNFQENNYGNGGDGGDYVRAEALDGSGTNNANFATPPDGSRPRMQMYLWGGNLQRPLRVTSPNGQTRQYDFARANFGGELPDDGNLAGELVLA